MKFTFGLILMVSLAIGSQAFVMKCNPALTDCFRDPCVGAMCPAYPDAMCRTDCQCQPEWYDSSGQVVQGCFNKG